jgi:hypothetical protein
MTQGHRPLATVLLAASFILSVVGVGCAGRVSYRAYDPGYNDYHAWDSHERVYYNQWTTETHRSNKDFRKLGPDDQKEDWNWRHNHPDK